MWNFQKAPAPPTIHQNLIFRVQEAVFVLQRSVRESLPSQLACGEIELDALGVQ
jgi:hypothetical protein